MFTTPLTIALTLVQGGLLFAAVLWKLYQLCRAPHDVPLRAVTGCLASAAVAYPFGVAAGSPMPPARGPMLLMLGQLGMISLANYCLLSFFVYSVLPPHRARIRLWWELVPLTTSLLLMTVSALTGPQGPSDSPHPDFPTMVFYAAADLYSAYSLGAALLFTVRYRRGAEPRLARGLWIAAIGLAGESFGSAMLSLVTIVQWATPLILPSALYFPLGPGILLLIVGVTYPGAVARLATIRLWWRHLLLYHRLRPLWTALHDAFPENVLNPAPVSSWRDRLSVRAVHRRYYRRVIECRDGLVHISPYLVQLRPDGHQRTPTALEDDLVRALHTHAAGEPAPTETAAVVAAPTGDGGLDEDVEMLVALSDALRNAPPRPHRTDTVDAVVT